jgi:glycosyltransferase 2 family protein
MKRAYRNALRSAVTLAALGAVLLRADLGQIWATLRSADWRLLLAAVALTQLGIGLRALRWRALLDAQGLSMPLRRLIGLYYIGALFSGVLPSGIGGDLVRMYEVSRGEATGTQAVSTVLWERLIGLLALFGVALAALPWSWGMVPPAAGAIVLAMALGVAAGLGMLLKPGLVEAAARRSRLAARLLRHPRVRALYATFRLYDRRALTRAGLAALGLNLSAIAVQACLARGLAMPVGLGHLLVFVPIISALMAAPVSIGGLGVREAAYLLLYTQVGATPAQALAMSLLSHGLQVVTGLLGGLYCGWVNLHGWACSRKGVEPETPQRPLPEDACGEA